LWPFRQRKRSKTALLLTLMPTVDRSFIYSPRSSSKMVQIGVNAQSQSGSTATPTTISRTRTGSRLPKWRKIIEEGGNATTGLSALWDSVACDPGELVIVRTTKTTFLPNWFQRTSSHSGPIAVINYGAGCATCESPTLSPTNADNRASAAFYRNSERRRSCFQGLRFSENCVKRCI
jgi:hypothetical protein